MLTGKKDFISEDKMGGLTYHWSWVIDYFSGALGILSIWIPDPVDHGFLGTWGITDVFFRRKTSSTHRKSQLASSLRVLSNIVIG